MYIETFKLFIAKIIFEDSIIKRPLLNSLFQIASVDEKPGVKREITMLENEVYEWQVKIYELHMQILDEEERLAKTQREAITRDIQGKLK